MAKYKGERTIALATREQKVGPVDLFRLDLSF